MSVMIPIAISAIAALWAFLEYKHRPYWSLMPGLAIVIACHVSVAVWAIWLMVVFI